jgi:hypothetical protein
MRVQSFVIIATLVATGCSSPVDEDPATPSSDALVSGFVEVPPLTPEERAAILSKYETVVHTGIRDELYEKAILYYDTNVTNIPNKDVLTVIDFQKHSGKKRFFIVDLKTAGTAVEEHVAAHGEGSDPNDDGIATSFSNVDGSHKSSVGYYLTAETYSGSNGYSLRLDGLSATNSNARSRAIVVHGADYVDEDRSKQGLSWGCPALDRGVSRQVIDKIKNGSLIFASN